jgi:hypothetical protein
MFPAQGDLVQRLGGVWQADFGQLILIGIIVNTVMGAGLWWCVVRKWKVRARALSPTHRRHPGEGRGPASSVCSAFRWRAFI